MCASVHTLECNLPTTPTTLTPHLEKADRSDATIIRVRSPDLLVKFFFVSRTQWVRRWWVWRNGLKSWRTRQETPVLTLVKYTFHQVKCLHLCSHRPTKFKVRMKHQSWIWGRTQNISEGSRSGVGQLQLWTNECVEKQVSAPVVATKKGSEQLFRSPRM